MEINALKKNLNKYLTDGRYDKLLILDYLFSNTNYKELCKIYNKTPNLHKGLFSASYLKRKSYEDIYCKGYCLKNNSINEYIGIILFILERNINIIKKYISLRSKYENALLLGKYEFALQYIKEINSSVSYSLWAVEQEIKLSRLTGGLNNCSKTTDKFYKIKNLIRICCPYYFKTSSIEYPSENDIDQYFSMLTDHDIDPDFRNAIISNTCSFKFNPQSEDWLYQMSNSSIIDMYNSLRDNLWNLSCETRMSESFKEYIRKIGILTNDMIIKKYVYLNDIDKDNSIINKKRDKLLIDYYKEEYQSVIINGTKYLEDNPSDFVILDFVVRSYINGKIEYTLDENQDIILNKVKLFYYNLLLGREPFIIYYKKLKTICESLYSFQCFRYLYTVINSYNNSAKLDIYSERYKYSPYLNITDLYYVSDPITYIKSWNPNGESNFIIDIIEGKIVSKDCEDIFITHTKETNKILFNLEKRWNESVIPEYLRSIVATYLFNEYVDKMKWRESISFFVESKLTFPNIDIKYNKSELNIKLENQVSDDLGIPLELAIFYTMIDFSNAKRYIAYKHYLKSINIEKASQIKNIKSPKVLFFLKYVSDIKTMGLHRRQFKSYEQVIEERIAICNNIPDKEMLNEIAELIKQQKIKSLIQRIDESKIFVDEDGIKKNELEEVKLLFRLYQSTDKDVSFSDVGLQILVDILKRCNKAEYNFLFVNENSIIAESCKTNYKYYLFKQIYCGIRDHFLVNPKYGLDFYLSTRIRHGTLINQIRMHFEEHQLVTNIGEYGQYSLNTYWTDNKLCLTGEERERCLQYFLSFTKEVDRIIYRIKDEYIQIKTEQHSNKKNAIFNFSIEEIEYEIQSLYTTCENIDFNTCVNRIFNNLWLLTEDNLKYLRRTLNEERNNLLSQLKKLQKDIFATVNNEDIISPLRTAISQCSTELQRDFAIVNSWFQRCNMTDFNFSLQDVIDTCITIINNMNTSKLQIKVQNSSVVFRSVEQPKTTRNTQA